MTRVILLLFLILAAARFIWRLLESVMRAASGPRVARRARRRSAGVGEDAAVPGVRHLRGAGKGHQRRERRRPGVFLQREVPR